MRVAFSVVGDNKGCTMLIIKVVAMDARHGGSVVNNAATSQERK
jgi:hypothetical protein